MASGRQTGAYSVGEDKRRGGGWWKWLLLLLALLALILVLVLLFSGDDDDESASQGVSTTAQESAPSGGSGDEATSGAAAGAGTLTAAGTSLLSSAGGNIEGSVGQDATGENLKVLSVVEDEGFFAGTSEADRVYVEYGGDVGEDEQDSGLPQVGDTVNLTGPVRPAPEDPAQTLNLDAAEAKVVTDQGAYVNAETVEQAG